MLSIEPYIGTSTLQSKHAFDLTFTEDKPTRVDLRTLFHDQDCYVMDAKSMGNLGRYLNVSDYFSHHRPS